MPTKAELRQQVLEKRNALDPAWCRRTSATVCHEIEGLYLFQEAKRIMSFAALCGEPDLVYLFDRYACSREKLFYYPRVIGGVQMEICQVQSESDLQPGAYNILEPSTALPPVEKHTPRLIFVPALAVDISGNRLGFGKGYYDHFLEDVTVLKVAVVFDDFLIREEEAINSDIFDVAMDMVVTEKNVYHTTKGTTV